MKFQKGQCANPNGRPLGSGHKQKLFNEHVMPIKKDLIKKVIEMAMDGNEQMLKLLVERIIPKTTDAPVTFKIDRRKIDEESLLDASEDVIRNVAEGEMMTDEAKGVTDLIKGHRDALVLQHLSKKMEELQKKFETMGK